MLKRHLLSFLFSALWVWSCSSPPPPVSSSAAGDAYRENQFLRDSAIKMLQTGDLVLRLGNDVTSSMLSQLNLREKKYSHCGIVVVEEGKPYIYHSIGGEYNPDQKIKRETPAQWFSPDNNLAIAIARLHIDSAGLGKAAKTVQAYYKEGKKFDMEFDLASDDRLYCAEMIWKSVQTAIDDSAFFPITTAFGRKYIGIDDLYYHPHSSLICRVQYK